MNKSSFANTVASTEVLPAKSIQRYLSLDVLRGMRGLLERGAISLLQVEVNRPLWARSGRTANDLMQLMTPLGYSLLGEQRRFLRSDDWAIEDFIFFAPAFRSLAEEPA